MKAPAILTIAVAAALAVATTAPSASAMVTQNATAGAVQQSNHTDDLTITRNIRRALIKNKSLSIEAHNVTIITKEGRVTLRGRVKSEAEKQTVASTAAGIAGAGNVDDQLTASQ